jgi:signal transduction histidine kinase
MAMSIFGFIAYVPSVYLSIQENLWTVVILDTFVLVGILSLFIFRNIPYSIRVAGLLFTIYLLGIALLILLGPNGAGMIWLFAFPILTSILAGLRPAIFAIVINAVSVILLGALNLFHALDQTLMSNYHIESWSIISVNFICLNLLTSIPIATLVNGLEKSLKEEEKTEALLREEQKKLIESKERAEDLNRLKTNFLANMSHEFRTPVNGILGLIQVINEEYKDDKDLLYNTSLIKLSANRLLNTITSIIEISRSESERGHLKISKVNPRNIIHEITPMFQAMALKKGLKFTIRTDTNECFLMLDENVFVQILNNIIGNAVKFTESGEVIIETTNIIKEETRYYRIMIKDTGIGISEEFQEKVFNPFEQESQGYGRRFEGSGLGLSIAKKYTELFGGKIIFRSKKGEGTTFELIFPCI